MCTNFFWEYFGWPLLTQKMSKSSLYMFFDIYIMSQKHLISSIWTICEWVMAIQSFLKKLCIHARPSLRHMSSPSRPKDLGSNCRCSGNMVIGCTTCLEHLYPFPLPIVESPQANFLITTLYYAATSIIWHNLHDQTL
jgi:hypothetical protein